MDMIHQSACISFGKYYLLLSRCKRIEDYQLGMKPLYYPKSLFRFAYLLGQKITSDYSEQTALLPEPLCCFEINVVEDYCHAATC